MWVASREKSRLDDFKATVPEKFHANLRFFQGVVSTEEDCSRLKDEILKLDGKINHVVSSVGGWWEEGTLTETSLAEYKKIIDDATLSHFVVFKTFGKILSETPNSTYTFISGGSGEATHFLPKASLVPIMSSTVYGIYTAASSEFKDNPNLAVMQFRLFLWIRAKEDSNFDAKTSDFEVGHDYIGKFMPKMIAKHKSEIYRVRNRTQGDELYQQLTA